MPEEKVEYEVEQEPELICPLRMIAADITEGTDNPTYPECLKEKCAWWCTVLDAHMCSMAVMPDTLYALYESIEDVRTKLR